VISPITLFGYLLPMPFNNPPVFNQAASFSSEPSGKHGKLAKNIFV
jgi:hypothetical protein